MSDFAKTIFSFQNKIKLLWIDINTSFLQHFPLPKGLVNSENDLCSEKIKVYVESLIIIIIIIIVGVSTNLSAWFSDLENLRPTLLLW